MASPQRAARLNDLTAEIFSPPYLFNVDGTLATRPSISDAPVSVGYGQTFTVADTGCELDHQGDLDPHFVRDTLI